MKIKLNRHSNVNNWDRTGAVFIAPVQKGGEGGGSFLSRGQEETPGVLQDPLGRRLGGSKGRISARQRNDVALESLEDDQRVSQSASGMIQNPFELRNFVIKFSVENQNFGLIQNYLNP